MGLCQIKKVLHSKGNNQESEEAINEMMWESEKRKRNGRKYFQTIYLISGKFLKYVKDSYNLRAKKKKERKKERTPR